MMSAESHKRDTALAVAILDAGSPQEAKRLVNQFRVRVWNDAIETAAIKAEGPNARSLLH